MGEAVFFRNLTTKGLTAINSGERYFEGYLTVQVKDKQGEVTIVDELMKVLPIWIDRGAPISDTHSNRIIGKGINYSKVDYKDTDGEIYPAIKITGKIHKNYELDNDIWAKIKSGEYKGLSFGGATKSDREPMRMKDGSIAYSLKDLEHYEVAVCRDPAVPLALITEFNTLAKAAVDGVDLGGGRMLIKCDKFGCYVDKDDEPLILPTSTTGEPIKASKEQQRLNELQIGKLDADEGVFDEEGTRAWGRMNDESTPANAKEYKDSGQHAADKKIVESQGTFNHRDGKWEKKKTNKEGGLKAPEARNEALVYDDKTHDQPSETPEENQKKVKKVSDEKAGTLLDEDQAVQSGKVRPPTPKHTYKPSDKTHKLEHAKDLIDDHIEEMKKGEDWSNADGDRHGMYNQDTDEGGMGKKHTGPKTCKCGDPKCKDPKCKKHKREVGTGYGAEQNDTGEVHWSGSGSPYPKKKGYSDEFKEDKENWEQQKYKKPRKKKKAIITNIYSRLKSLDFMLKKEKKDKLSEFLGRFAEHDPNEYIAALNADIVEQEKEKDKKLGRKERRSISLPKQTRYPVGTKKSTTITNILSRLKSLDFLLLGQCHIEHEGTCVEAQAEEASEETKRKFKKRKKKSEMQLKNIQSRVEISNFLLRSSDDDREIVEVDGKTTTGKKKPVEYTHDKEQKQRQALEHIATVRDMILDGKPKKKKKIKKDGEFGGMNTGEVEWTEPRDTANSRKKRDKDVA